MPPCSAACRRPGLVVASGEPFRVASRDGGGAARAHQAVRCRRRQGGGAPGRGAGHDTSWVTERFGCAAARARSPGRKTIPRPRRPAAEHPPGRADGPARPLIASAGSGLASCCTRAIREHGASISQSAAAGSRQAEARLGDCARTPEGSAPGMRSRLEGLLGQARPRGWRAACDQPSAPRPRCWSPATSPATDVAGVRSPLQPQDDAAIDKVMQVRRSMWPGGNPVAIRAMFPCTRTGKHREDNAGDVAERLKAAVC